MINIAGPWKKLALMGSVSAVALLAGGAFTVARAGGASAQLSVASLTHLAAQANAGGGPLSSAAVQAQIALSVAHLTQAAQAVRNQEAAQAAASASAALLFNGQPLLSGLQCSPQCDPVSPGSTAPSDPSLWINANVPTKSGATETIQQTAQNAVLTWSKFNLNNGETLNFDQQGNATWSVLNRVIDPSMLPSEIFGVINAPGSVYVINRNGIIFGGTAQINVHSLIASALDVGDPTMSIAERNAFFLNNGITDPANLPGHFSFSYDASDSTLQGDVIVQAGAVINANIATSIGADAGGSVYLFAPNVSNAGTINTPAGETLMVAAQAVQLTPNAYLDAGIGAVAGSGQSTAPYTLSPDASFRGTGVNTSQEALLTPTGESTPLATPWRLDGQGEITSLGPGGQGNVTNSGYIDATRGVVILNGDYVTAAPGSVIEADTSISRNAQVFLDARLNLTLAANSAVLILPDETGETMPQNSIGNFVPPSVEMQGHLIDMEPGSLIMAPGATVTATGTEFVSNNNPKTPVGVVDANIYPAGLAPVTFGQSGYQAAQIYMAPDSAVDVSGLDDVVLPMSANFVTFKPFGNEFADQPLQRDGALVGQSLTVDIRQSGTFDGVSWEGTPLADVSGLIGDIPVSLDQLLTTGGTVTMAFANDVPSGVAPAGAIVTRQGSSIDIAGGYIQYLAGLNQSSELISADGQIVNIAAANPLETYVGVAGVSTLLHPHWGSTTTETFVDPLLAGAGAQIEPSYVEGRDAGTISLSATSYALDGSYSAGVIDGQLQNAAGQKGAAATAHTPEASATAMPTAGALTINTANTQLITPPGGNQELYNTNALTIAENVTPLDPSFQAGDALPADRADDTELSASILSAAGFAQISAKTGGAITVTADAELTVAPGGSISLKGGSADIEGDLTAHSGSISVQITSSDGAVGVAPGAGAGPYDLTVGPNAVIDTSGIWVNDSGATPDTLVGGAYVNGGSITLLTDNNSYLGPTPLPNQPDYIDLTGNIVLDAGSLLDVSSGGRIQPNGTFQRDSLGRPVGNGGNVTLETYATGWSVQGASTGQVAPTTALPDATIIFGGASGAATAAALDNTIDGFGFAQGGTLTIQAPTIQIGGIAPTPPTPPSPSDPNFAADEATYTLAEAAYVGTLYLSQSFFDGNGFGAYSLSSVVGGTTVAAGNLTLQQQNYLATAALSALPTGGKPGTVTGVGVLPIGQQTPVDLTLAATLPGVPFEPYDPTAAAAQSPAPQIALSIAAGATITTAPCNLAGVCGAINIDVSGRDDFNLSNSDAYVEASQVGVAEIGGEIQAPGGTITLTGGNDSEFWLDSTAVLDVAGTTVVNPLQARFTTGTVLPGGRVNVVTVATDEISTLVAEPGALINVSGASGTLDLPTSQPLDAIAPPAFVPQTLWSDAGSIDFQVSTLLFDGTIAAEPGAPLGNGGSLSISTPKSSGTITVQNGFVVPTSLTPTQFVPANLASQIVFEADRLTGSGIASLTLTAGDLAGDATVGGGTNGAYAPGTIQFTQSVSIGGLQSLALDAGTIALNGAIDVSLQANYVALRGAGRTTAQAGLGDLLVEGDTIDIAAGGHSGGNVELSGVANATFVSSGDIRLRVPLVDIAQDIGVMTGDLISAGNMTFDAAQIYPVSAVDFSIKSSSPTGVITFESNGTPSAAPLSAGGSLTVDADQIVQDGTVLAPLGTLRLGAQTTADLSPNDTDSTFVATQSVILGAGSVTSVSLDGAIVPFGETADDTNWSYNSGEGTPLTGPPEKDLIINGAAVSVNSGATVNLSGGGDIQAIEFVPGTGGTRNVLEGANVYAIIPGYNPGAAPIDLDFLTNFAQSEPAAGSSVYLSGGPGLAAGVYTLLPAAYATLPGAYRVTVVANSQDALTSSNGVLSDGTIVSAGYFTNSQAGTQAARSVDFDVQSSAIWRQYSEIDQTAGNTYFAQSSFAGPTGALPQLPEDAGHAIISAAAALNLAGQFVTAPAPGGHDAEIDIASQDIEIVAPGTTASAGYVSIDASQLSALDADSLLIGGVRGIGADNGTITAVSESVVVDNDASDPLVAPQLILTTAASENPPNPTNAKRGLEIDSGSVIEASGALSPNDATTYAVVNASNGNSQGSLLALSTGAPLTIERQNLGPAQALLNIMPGAIISAPSLVLDSTDLIEAQGATLTVSNLVIASRGIDFGAGTPAKEGFTVTSDILAQLEQAQNLTLSTYDINNAGSINFLGNSSLTLVGSNSTLTLNTPTLVAANGAAVTLAAGTITFTNSGAEPPASTAGTGTLQLNANTIAFAAGDKVLSGFGTANFNAAQEIAFTGTGSLNAGAASLAFATPLVLVGPGAQQTVTTTATVSFNPAGANAPVTAPDLGGTLTVDAAAISDNTLIEALAGGVTLEASSGNVTLGANAEILANGYVQNFFDVTQVASGGTVDLIADQGNIDIATGASIDVSSGVGDSGDAGTVALSAANGVISSNGGVFDVGTIAGSIPGDSGGSLQIDAQSIGTTELTIPALFSNSVSVELRQGNIDLAAGQAVTAKTVTLTADAGTISIEGTIDASGTVGGSIALWGGQGVTLNAGGLLEAQATDANEQGGSVVLGTQIAANNGSANDGVIDLAGGTIDVSNLANAALDGTVRLRAPLTASGDDVAIGATVATNIVGASSVTIEGFKVFSTTNGSGFDGTIDPLNDPGFYGPGGTLVNFVQNFALSAGAQQRFAGLGNVIYQPGIELDNPNGNITVASNWNLGAGVAGDLVNATAFKVGGVTVPVGTVITDANGNLLPQYASYTGALAFEQGVSQISSLYYRTDGGSPLGVAPMITIRAAGNLDINASITDGFFQTENRLDPTYVKALNGWLANFGGGAETSSDGNYIFAGAEYGLPGMAPPPIAPYDPGANSISPTATADDPAPIQQADLFPLIPDASGTIVGPTGNFDAIGSSSYRLTGGANLASANPLGLQPLSSFAANSGDVVINGDTFVPSKNQNNENVYLPTVVRTGTGSIDIAAGQDFVLADASAPGAVYTAGRNSAPLPSADYMLPAGSTVPVAQDPAGFLEPQLVACEVKDNCYLPGVITTPAFPVDGGNLTVLAQRDIIGNTLPAVVPAGSDPKTAAAREYYWPWLMTQSTALTDTEDGAFSPLSAFLSTGQVSTPQQTAWWINFGSFDQGLMSVGGNISVYAGRDISRLGVSEPTTARFSGGLSSTIVDSATGAVVPNLPVENLNPSGNLTVVAGRNLLSGSYYEGSGTGTITVGGSVESNLTIVTTNNKEREPLSTVLAVDTGTISLAARGAVDLAGVVSATSLQNVANLSSGSPGASLFVSSYGNESAVSIEAVSGAITINSLTDPTALVDPRNLLANGTAVSGFPGVTDYPASFSAVALLDGINVESSIEMAASQNGSLDLLAQTSIDTGTAGPTSTLSQTVLQPDAIITGPSLIEQVFDPADPLSGFAPTLGSSVADAGALLLHSDDPTPDLFYAVTGDINGAPSSDIDPLSWEVDKPAIVHAGRDIVDLSFFGENLKATDVTQIIAGRNLFYTGAWQQFLFNEEPSSWHEQRAANGIGENNAGLSLAGPGFFDIEAGGNLGPFVTAQGDQLANGDTLSGKTGTGIIAFGNTLVVGNRLMLNDQDPVGDGDYNTFANNQNFLLPAQGADIVTMFGVSKGADYQAVINQYINPATATSAINYLPALQLLLGAPSADEAWTEFNALPADLQHMFVDELFFNELALAGQATNGNAAPYAEGYGIINTLFPAALGYTDNGASGSGPASRVLTGNLDLLHATIKTLQAKTVPVQQLGSFTTAGSLGGGIYILGPGGDIDVGTTALEINTKLTASDIGILTLDNGPIETFTDGSVLVDQSRILTVQGGDILMWSSNGNLDAGRGAKSTVDFTPLTVSFDFNDVQYLNLNGLVTGAGIGTIQGTPDAPTASAELVAPRGAVDAGAAGLRSTGNLVIAAEEVINAANISVTGTVSGVPQSASVNLGSLESGSAAGGQAANSAQSIASTLARVNPSAGEQLPSIITVEVLGYGDCSTSPNGCP